MPNIAKIEKVSKLKKLFETHDSFFIADYQGLSVADETELRKKLRENQARYLVAKNTLLKIATKEAGREGLDEFLSGPTAIAFASGDAAPVAKILHESFKDKELPRIKVFVLDGELHKAEEIEKLADLPSRIVLLSQLVSTVEAPFTSLIGTIDSFFQELIGTVDALAEKKKVEA
jgi:large subunit ribosomal protein L10